MTIEQPVVDPGSTDPRRRWLAAIGGVAALLVVLLIWLLARGGSNKPHRLTSSRSTTTTTEATTTSSSTSTSTSTTAKKAAVSTSTTAARPASSPASASGAFLKAPPPPKLQSTAPPSSACDTLGDGGWTVTQCNTFAQAGPSGASVVALVEKQPGPSGTEAWRAFVLHFSYGSGKWLVDLEYDDDAGSQTSSIKYVAKDMTGDGISELVFGFRLLGSGSILDYDVVDRMFSGVHVAAHRELSHGQAKVAAAGVTDWQAKYDNGAPNCCPTYVEQDTVSWSGSAWVITPGPHSSAAGSGDF